MLAILQGFAVIVVSFCLIAPLVWWLLKDEGETAELDRVANDETQIIQRPHAPELEVVRAPDITETLIVDIRPVEDERQPTIDELGEWRPWEHDTEQPLLLAHVLMTGQWQLDARELGWVAA